MYPFGLNAEQTSAQLSQYLTVHLSKKLGIEIEIVLEIKTDHKINFESHTKALYVVKSLKVESITGNS